MPKKKDKKKSDGYFYVTKIAEGFLIGLGLAVLDYGIRKILEPKEPKVDDMFI